MAGQYATTTRRRQVSIPIGAAIGGIILFAVLILIPGALSYGPDDPRVLAALATSAFLSFTWLVGIALLWLPLWLLAERHRPIGWSTAAIAGAVLGPPMSVVIFAFLWAFAAAMGALEDTPYRWQDSVKPLAVLAGACSVTGLIVASTMWRIAYRRVLASAAADAFD